MNIRKKFLQVANRWQTILALFYDWTFCHRIANFQTVNMQQSSLLAR
jgi:hypothetical protein